MESDHCGFKWAIVYLSIIFTALWIMLFALVAVDAYIDFRENNTTITGDYNE